MSMIDFMLSLVEHDFLKIISAFRIFGTNTVICEVVIGKLWLLELNLSILILNIVKQLFKVTSSVDLDQLALS